MLNKILTLLGKEPKEGKDEPKDVTGFRIVNGVLYIDNEQVYLNPDTVDFPQELLDSEDVESLNTSVLQNSQNLPEGKQSLTLQNQDKHVYPAGILQHEGRDGEDRNRDWCRTMGICHVLCNHAL